MEVRSTEESSTSHRERGHLQEAIGGEKLKHLVDAITTGIECPHEGTCTCPCKYLWAEVILLKPLEDTKVGESLNTATT